jgi:hypothetical protein
VLRVKRWRLSPYAGETFFFLGYEPYKDLNGSAIFIKQNVIAITHQIKDMTCVL